MTKQKSTKRALLMSALALLMCVSMLIGSTFAWFTDSVTSSGNKIKAGTLDVDLLMGTAVNTYTSIADKNAAIFGANSLVAQNNPADTLWEPGKTQIVYLAVENKGNLDLKYNIALNVVDGGLIGSLEYAIIDGAKYGDIDVNNVNSWAALKANAQTGDVVAGTTVAAPNGAITVAEKIEYFALAVHMKEDADNKYQGKDITIDVTVLATQLASEKDSFDNQYDKDATYLNTDADGNYLISNANELVYFAKSVNVDGETYTGKTVKLTADIDLAGKNWIPVGGSGSVASYPNKTFSGTFDGDGKTISNMKVNVTGEFASAGLFGTANRATIKNVKISEADIRSTHYAGAILGYDTETTVISGCSVVNSVIASAAENSTGSWDNGDKVGGIVGYMNIADVSNCSVSNTSIQGYRDIGGIIGYIGGGTVSACTINNVTIYVDNTHNYKNYTTLSEHDANDYVGESHGTVSDCNGTANINSLITVSTAEELVYFADSVNNGKKTYAGETVMLTADIDLAGKVWIPVGQTQVSSFQGTFDGQGHTIKNMTVNYTGTNSNYACGLFGWIELHNGTPIVIQNVKFDNANVTGIKYTGVVAGYANGASGAEIKNCVVTNSTVTSNSKNAGGIIGYMGKGVLTGNTVSGCTISAKCDVGGIANSVEPAVTFTKNKVENTKIYYEEDQSYDAAGIFTGGKVVYRDDNNKTTFVPDSTNTNSNVTVNKIYN